MFHFCGIEKAIIKRVKLLTNIQGDSPYTFFPRNLCRLMYSKYIYINIYLHISWKHTFTQSLKIWHLFPQQTIPRHFSQLPEHLRGKKEVCGFKLATLFLSQLLSSPCTGLLVWQKDVAVCDKQHLTYLHHRKGLLGILSPLYLVWVTAAAWGVCWHNFHIIFILFIVSWRLQHEVITMIRR